MTGRGRASAILGGLVGGFLWTFCASGPAPAQVPTSQCIANVAAQGTSDAITSAQLPCGTTTNLVLLTALAANTTTTPTYAPVGSPPLPIVRGSGSALSPGDITGPGFVALLSSTGTSWVLLNPGGSNATLGGNNTFTGANTFTGGVTLPGQISVKAAPYNAACNWNGTTGTDDHVAIQAAITAARAAGYGIIIPAQCYSSVGINFGNVPVSGAQLLVATNPPQGDGIICAASIAAPCVTEGVPSSNIPGGALRDLMVGYSGTPVSGDTALLIEGFNTNTFNVLAFNAYDGWTFFDGIASHNVQSFTWNILHDHIVDNGFPEVYFDECRLGMNGSGDQTNSNAFIGVTGYDPNTLMLAHCQFNLGSQSPKYIMDFFSLTNQNDGVYEISDSVADMSIGASGAIVHSDGTGTCFRCNFGPNFTINAPSTPMFAMGSSAAMSQSFFHDSNYFISSFTMPGSVQYDEFHVSNLNILGSFTVNGGANSIAMIDGVEAAGPMVITGGPWFLDLSNVTSKTSYADNTATGTIHASGTPGMAFLPVMSFAAGTLLEANAVSSGTGGVNGTAVYSVGGGTCGTTPTVNVTWTSGVMAVSSIANAGTCTAFPPSPAPLTYVSGTASGWTGATASVATATSSIAATNAQRMPDGSISVPFGVRLTGMGSSSGAPVIYGMPYTCSSYAYGQTNIQLANVSNLGSLTGAVGVALNQGGNTVLFGQSSASGFGALSASNFGSGSVISATPSCFPQ